MSTMASIAVILAVAATPALAFAPTPGFMPLGRANGGLKSCPTARVASRSLSLRMGWLDGFTVDKLYGAAPGSKVDQYSGFIEKEGMRTFSFDGRVVKSVPVHASKTVAGRNPPANAPGAQTGGFNPFGFLGSTTLTKAGSGKAKENQDGVLVVPDLYDGINLYCVFDGHGDYGALVTEWTSNNLPSYIAAALEKGRPGKLLNSLTEAFRLADAALVEALGEQVAIDSGTTVAATLIKGDLVLVAGLGDSRVVLGSIVAKTKLAAQALTLDQSPNVPTERKRIEKAGGEVRGEGVGRVYAKGQEFPALAVSRALGDLDGKNYGVTCDPQFIGWKARKAEDFVVVLASDGVWNALGNEFVVDLCSRHRDTKNAEAAAADVVSEARRAWEELAKGRIDDISAIVIYL